jgi:Flp pilus assembly pilin Flp
MPRGSRHRDLAWRRQSTMANQAFELRLHQNRHTKECPVPGDELIKLYIRFVHRERGQTMAEYAIVLAVITIAIIAAFGALSGSIKGALTKITADI